MEQIATLLFISIGLFILFIGVLIWAFAKQNSSLKWMAFILFSGFVISTFYTAYTFFTKALHKIEALVKPRSGEEIYLALFGPPKTNCVKVTNQIDQVIPKVDFAIWLEFETCPIELQRVLSQKEYSLTELSLNQYELDHVPLLDSVSWFKPSTLGDTIYVFENSSPDHRNIQTLWTNRDSTKVFLRDIAD